MKTITIREILNGWSKEDLANLYYLLEGRKTGAHLAMIEESLKWLYHSRTRAKIESTAKNTFRSIMAKVEKKQAQKVQSDALRSVPTYDELLVEAAKHLDAYEGSPTREECETFVSHAVIIAALAKMSPSQRVKFFNTQIEFDRVAQQLGVKSPSFKGPLTTFAALGLAQASGFGVYLASTTALGFLTHAVGITLPFVVYTGLTSTIAFLIGPFGWLAAGVWGAWKLTQPTWKKIVPGIIYIASTNSRSNVRR